MSVSVSLNEISSASTIVYLIPAADMDERAIDGIQASLPFRSPKAPRIKDPEHMDPMSCLPGSSLNLRKYSWSRYF